VRVRVRARARARESVYTSLKPRPPGTAVLGYLAGVTKILAVRVPLSTNV